MAWLLIIASAVGVIIYGRAWPQAGWLHLRQMRLYQQCVRHPVMGGALAYSSNPAVGTGLAPQWLAMAGAFPPALSWNASCPASTVFLGELQSHHGQRCLVHIECGARWSPRNAQVIVGSQTITLNWTHALTNSAQLHGNKGAFNMPRSGNRPDVEIFTAKTDPADPAHIHFDYREFDVVTHVDAYLNDDGRINMNETESRAP